jgi:AcrR family transcriptional regulator
LSTAPGLVHDAFVATGPKKKRRRARFSAEEAREAILRATERRLVEVGPQGLRLQEIARDVGLSHPTVLHHVGSREALVEAVALRATEALQRDVLACFCDLPADADPEAVTLAALERIDEALRRRGHARVFAWLALAKVRPPEEALLRGLADAIHEAQKAIRPDASPEDARMQVLVVSAAMMGMAIVGSELLTMLAIPSSEAAHARFREWFARVLVAHAGAGAPP